MNDVRNTDGGRTDDDWLDPWLTWPIEARPGDDARFVTGVMQRVDRLPAPVLTMDALRRAARLRAREARIRRFTYGGMAVGVGAMAIGMRALDIGTLSASAWQLPVGAFIACAVLAAAALVDQDR